MKRSNSDCWSSLALTLYMQSLQSVVQNALEECDSRRLQSIAFPAIGIGKLKFPVDVAVETLVSSAFDYLLQNRSSTSIKKVILVGLEERVHTLFLSKIEQRCGVSPASVEPQPNHEDVHPMSGTVPDYPDLKLPTLQLDPPPEETPPMGTPREFYILAESDYHCSQAETELHQRVDEMIQTKVIEDETIKDLPTSFLTAFQANAKAAHVKVMIHHNPTRAELLGPKEDVQHAVSVLEHALVAVANYIIAINKQVSSALQHYHWTYTCGPEGMARSYGPGECYELEKAHQFQCKRVTFKREGSSEQVIVDMERLVEEGAGAAGTIQVHRVQREEGVFAVVTTTVHMHARSTGNRDEKTQNAWCQHYNSYIRCHSSDIYLYGNAPRSKWQFLSNVLVCVGEISETLANRNNGRPWIGFFQGAEGDSVPKGDLDFA